MADNQVRVVLWCVPRSVSTAFEVCMSYMNNVQIINEPFASAVYVGPEFKVKRKHLLEMREQMNKKTSHLDVHCETPWESNSLTYKNIKENILEAEYPGMKVVFVKDMSYAITEHLHMLPKGYRHAFLIRDPHKVFLSWKNLLNYNWYTGGGGEEVLLTTGKTGYDVLPEQHAFGESLQLYEHLVQTQIEPKPFIMDADDLLENPESILRQFCSFAGIEYTDKLLTWDRGNDVTRDWKASKEILQWNRIADFHVNAFSSKGFEKPKTALLSTEMSEDVVRCVDASRPSYRRLHALRTKPIS